MPIPPMPNWERRHNFLLLRKLKKQGHSDEFLNPENNFLVIPKRASAIKSLFYPTDSRKEPHSPTAGLVLLCCISESSQKLLGNWIWARQCLSSGTAWPSHHSCSHQPRSKADTPLDWSWVKWWRQKEWDTGMMIPQQIACPQKSVLA